MILIGQFDSPFVRRVALSLDALDLAYEHRSWSTFADAHRIRPLSPLLRVPVLVTDEGTALTDSAAILDFIDGQVAAPRRLVPAEEPARHRVMRAVALCTGVADKAVMLFYGRAMHAAPSPEWTARCAAQINDTLALIESERGASPFWFGDRLGQADITLACVWRFLTEAHPGLAPAASVPRIAGTCAALESTAPFRRLSRPFTPPS